LFIPLPAWSATSSLWPTRIEAAFVVSVTVTSKFTLPVLGEGLDVGFEPVPALPQPEMSTAMTIAGSRILISQT
jgi:hypothetical protein